MTLLLLPTRCLTDELSHRFFLLLKIARKSKVLFFFRLHTQENVYASSLRRRLFMAQHYTFFDISSCFSSCVDSLRKHSRESKKFSNKIHRTYGKSSTLSVTRMINQSQDSHSPSRGTYIFKYRQSSE